MASKESAKRAIVPEPLTKLSPPSGVFFLDELKNGSSVRKIEVKANRLIFGRVPDCDVIMEHPSISRYHGALLWSPKNEIEYENGTNTESYWYLVDCGSTHGTNCNKLPVDAGKMVKVSPNNNIIKFGGSTRFFILETPVEDREEEEEEVPQRKVTKSSNQEDEIEPDTGCSWGISAADAQDDDGEENGDSQALKSIISSLKSGKSALESTNKASYAENPFKCLQQWFDREGYDFDYKVDEDSGKFKCVIELPIDGQWIPIDSSQCAKKKEALSKCCLQACSILDQAQLLYPWQTRQKREEAKKNRDVDYDDDDDAMIDETSANKRKKMKLTNSNEVETHESLMAKWKTTGDELIKLRVRLASVGLESGVTPELPSEVGSTGTAGDSLDEFMQEITTTKKYGLTMNEKIEKSNLRIEIKQLETERRRLERLIKIAAPSALSLLPKPKTVLKTPPSNDVILSTTQKSHVLPLEDAPSAAAENERATATHEDLEVTHEAQQQHLKTQNIDPTLKCADANENPIIKLEDNNSKLLQVETSISDSNAAQQRLSKAEAKALRKLKQSSIISAIEQEKEAERKKKIQESLESTEDYVGWVPPSNQSGDGKTHLNAKFGY